MIKIKIYILVSVILTLGAFLVFNGCSNTAAENGKTEIQKIIYPSSVSPLFSHFKLILGDGSNAGTPVDFENRDFFYTTNDGIQDWVVYKTPNAGKQGQN